MSDTKLENYKQEQIWLQMGEDLQEIIDMGHFPGIGYDAGSHWEAWAFFYPPEEAIPHEHEKVFADTAPEAVSELLALLKAKRK